MKLHVGIVCAAVMLAGCGSLKFQAGYQADAVTFYDPVPAYQVILDKDCKITTSVTALPGKERSVRPIAGIGSSALTASFQGGMLTSFGQTTDAQLDELGTMIGTAFGLGGFSASAAPTSTPTLPCPAVILVPITDGRADISRASVLRLTDMLSQVR